MSTKLLLTRVMLLTLLAPGWLLAASEPEFVDLFVAGRDTFPSVRIPAMAVTRKGVVLAIAEGRQGRADRADNKLILKRSLDGGRTWTAQQTIADDAPGSLNNPCVVIEEHAGRIFVMCQSYPPGVSERNGAARVGISGPAVVRNLLTTSDDEGATWTELKDVTASTKRPDRMSIMASGPGMGIQLQRGPHKGRLIIPFNGGHFNYWDVFAVYSDDRGTNWLMGEFAPGCRVPGQKGREISLVNEVQMVELADGSVLLNSRKWGGQTLRKIATSKDGGVTWSQIEEEPALRDPGCMASIFRYTFPESGGQSRILYSGPDSARRDNGTVYLSYDEGRTWPVKKVLFPGSFAYSVLTALPDGTIACLFETDGANRIVFARFTLGWLTDGKDSLPSVQR